MDNTLDNTSFNFYQETAEQLLELDDVTIGKFFRTAVEARLNGKTEHDFVGLEKMSYTLMKGQLDRAETKRLTSKANGSQPKAKGEPNGSQPKAKGEPNPKPNTNTSTKYEYEDEDEYEVRDTSTKTWDACAEPAKPSLTPPMSPLFINLPLNDKSEYAISEAQVADWTTLYPAVDIRQALRNMRGWLDSNPTKRKTSTGILRFVTGWLAKEQNSGGTPYQQNAGVPIRAAPNAQNQSPTAFKPSTGGRSFDEFRNN